MWSGGSETVRPARLTQISSTGVPVRRSREDEVVRAVVFDMSGTLTDPAVEVTRRQVVPEQRPR